MVIASFASWTCVILIIVSCLSAAVANNNAAHGNNDADTCPLILLTHNAKDSASEARQERYKLDRGCVLKSETEMTFGDTTNRYREWCCPVSTNSRQQKRNLEQVDPTLEIPNPIPVSSSSSGEEEEEEEQEDDLNHPLEAYAAYLPYNLDRLDQRYLPLDQSYHPPVLSTSQNTVHVYVIDSGIDPGNAVFDDISISFDYPSIQGAKDCCGHGTRVASIIASYVTGVNCRGVDGAESSANLVIHSVSVLGCDCGGSIQDLLQGLSYIQNHGPRPGILSLSLGSAKSTTLNSALSSMTNSGDFVAFVAAGNDNVDACTTSPASATNVVVVGATTPNDYRSSYSNYGSCLDIFAPGDNIYAALMGSANQISPESGTSFAQPHVAGLCARHLLRNPSDLANIASCWTAIQNSATVNIVNNVGPNSPNLMAFSGSAGPNPPPPPLPPPTTGGNPPQPPPNNPNQPQLPPNQNAGDVCEWTLWLTPIPVVLAAIVYPLSYLF